jgi:hypothetical protein
VEPDQATTRLREATAQFDFPRLSYISEHEFTIDDAVGACPYSSVAVFVSMQPNSYPDLFAFWPDALRCLAENGAGEIFRSWDRVSQEISCRSVVSSELVSRLRDALAPFSRSPNVPTLPQTFSQAFEVLGVPDYEVYVGTWESGEERHLALAVERAAV